MLTRCAHMLWQHALLFAPCALSLPYDMAPSPAPVLTIPSELRLRVYSALFGKHQSHFVFTESYPTNAGDTKILTGIYHVNRSSQILQTCRQIRDEALPVLMDSSEFFFSSTFDMSGLSTNRFCLKMDSHNIRHAQLSCHESSAL